MASIVKNKTASGLRYVIQLSPGEDNARPKISLGKVSRKQAEAAKTKIESVLKCRRTGEVISPAVQDWLNHIPGGLRQRLEKLSIIELSSNGDNFTVERWAEHYIKSRPDVKAITKGKWENVKNKLSAFFKDQYLHDVTIQQAKNFRVYLKTKAGLQENTLRRIIGISRQFFNAAIEAGLINKNPFIGQPVAVRANPSRFFYIKHETALKVLEACPDAQWRLIFGLARWGGLRCPSEVLRLKWQDIDFEHERFVVHSPKTEHHVDKGIRTVPMFPELKPLFRDAFEQARDGAVYCIDRRDRSSANLRTHMHRIIKRAGVDVWPKIFQNCRSTRETELFKMTGGNVKAVCSWIGNSPEIAMQHYAQVTEADLQEAAAMAVIKSAEKTVHKTVHNPVQTTAEQGCTEPHGTSSHSDVNPSDCEDLRELAVCCNSLQNKDLHPQGDSNPCHMDENHVS